MGHYFIIVSLLYNLPTLLLTGGEEVLNGDVVLRLDLDLLLVAEQALHQVALLRGLRTLSHALMWGAEAALLRCFFLVALNQIV